MTAKLCCSEVAVGTRLPARVASISRLENIMFCGAALDFAGPHWSERIARSVGLPDVIGNRALTAAKALQVVNEWTGDPGAVLEYRARLVKPVVIPDDDTGAVLHISGVVESLRENKRAGVDLLVATPDGEVLATVHVLVQLT